MLFLAVIGASTGYVLGRVKLQKTSTEASGGGTPSTGPGTQGPSDDRTTATPTSTAQGCLAETEAAVKQKFGSPGGLVQLLYISTKGTGSSGQAIGSEVWICKDSRGTLFYQGHRRSAAELAGAAREKLVDLDNALLLAEVKSNGSTGYVATNRDGSNITTYRVSTTVLVIEFPDGRSSTENVIAHEP